MATNGTALVQHEPMMQWSAEQLRVIQGLLAPGLSNDEIRLFAVVCRRTGLDPFSRQIYAIKRGGRMTIQAGIDGYRALAERSGVYAGQLGPFWCGDDGKWVDVWLSKSPPLAAKVGILRSDFKEPLWAVARLDAYRQPSNSLWNTMADVLLAKCAESLGLRRSFPQMMQGVYTHEEMEQAGPPENVVIEAETVEQ